MKETWMGTCVICGKLSQLRQKDGKLPIHGPHLNRCSGGEKLPRWKKQIK